MTPDRLDAAVAGKLIRPVNHSYIPNLKANVWPELQDPFYDTGSRYTVPYTTYGTGIAWRKDHVTEDIGGMDNPWDIFWRAQAYAGKVAVLDDSRESLTLALLHRKHLDVNTEDPKIVNQAAADLKQLTSICNVKVDITTYKTIPEGSTWLQEAWSGDMINGFLYYMPPHESPDVLAYWHGAKGRAPVQNDVWAIPTMSKKPVLAHMFMNYILDNDVAYENFAKFNGYQPPLNSIGPDVLVERGVIPENLRSAIIPRSAFGPGSLQEMTLTSRGQVLWQNAFSSFTSGA
jgi:spermidine/putrescine transport system substrate-binding protein